MSKAQMSNVNNGLDTSQNRVKKWVGKLAVNTLPKPPWVKSDLC
jgi:hypothetical protein